MEGWGRTRVSGQLSYFSQAYSGKTFVIFRVRFLALKLGLF